MISAEAPVTAPRNNLSRVLVTGASGFIGWNLCLALQTEGFGVLVHARQAGNQSSAEWRSADLADDAFDPAPLVEGVDAVVHLAGIAHLAGDDPMHAERVHRVNVTATRRLAEAAARSGVKRFVFISTVKVHGEKSPVIDGQPQPVTEKSPIVPPDNYAASKWQAEEAVHEICAGSRMECVILRPPLVYGPHVKANFYRLIRAVAHGWPLPLAGIRNRRSFLYAGNLCSAIVCALTHPAAAAGNAFVIADSALSTPELIRQIAAALECKPRLVHCPEVLLRLSGLASGQLPAIRRLTESLVIDDSHFRRTTGWTPPYTLEQAMRHTADWYRRQESGAT
jgi:UDP-glucose 4-epimerase